MSVDPELDNGSDHIDKCMDKDDQANRFLE